MPLPQPEVIRERASEILQRPDYQLQPLGEDGATWRDVLLEILVWIFKPFRVLFDWLDNISPILAWFVAGGLFLITIVLVVYIAWSVRRFLIRSPRQQNYQFEKSWIDIDPVMLERGAEREAASGNFILAIRLLLRAVLFRLSVRDGKRFSPGMTNREYLYRYRGTSFFQPLLVLVQTVDTKWYGLSRCDREDFQQCQLAHSQMVRQIQE